VLRLGFSERGVTEIMAVAEHVAGLTAAAEGLLLAPDVPAPSADPPPGLVAPADEAAPEVADTLAEVRAWAREALGVDGTPLFWRVLAHRPGLLAATWAKDRLVLGPGEIDAATKACVALAVAMFRQSRYWSAYLGQLARRQAGLDEAGLVELAGCVMHYVSYNTIAHGMRLEPPYHDMAAADFAPR
jgi:hypothetical protein